MSSIVHMHSGAARHPSAGDARVPLEEMRRRFRVDRFEAAERAAAAAAEEEGSAMEEEGAAAPAAVVAGGRGGLTKNHGHKRDAGGVPRAA